MTHKCQSIKSKQNQHRSFAEQSTTKTSATITSFTPPTFNLKKQKLNTEKTEAPEVSDSAMSKHIFASSADASPNDVSVSNPSGGNGNNIVTQRKQVFSSFQTPIQKKAVVNTPTPFTSIIQKKSKNNTNHRPEDTRGRMENVFKTNPQNTVLAPKTSSQQAIATKAVIQRQAATPTSPLSFADETRQIETTSLDSQGKPFTVNTPVFDKSRMGVEFPSLKIEGAGDEEIARAMRTLTPLEEGVEIDPGLRTQAVNVALQTVGRIRGIDNPRKEYNRAMEFRAAGERNNPGVSPALDVKRHPDFMGSLTQLKHGKILGDVTGVDPVFGALMNPTGGIVGSGNNALIPSDTYSNFPTVLHGIPHDAGGYLLNAHGIGPGYIYTGSEDKDTEDNRWSKMLWGNLKDPTNPLAGQDAGLTYWREAMNTWYLENEGRGVTP